MIEFPDLFWNLFNLIFSPLPFWQPWSLWHLSFCCWRWSSPGSVNAAPSRKSLGNRGVKSDDWRRSCSHSASFACGYFIFQCENRSPISYFRKLRFIFKTLRLNTLRSILHYLMHHFIYLFEMQISNPLLHSSRFWLFALRDRSNIFALAFSLWETSRPPPEASWTAQRNYWDEEIRKKWAYWLSDWRKKGLSNLISK